MFRLIPVLPPQMIAQLRDIAAKAQFVDGQSRIAYPPKRDLIFELSEFELSEVPALEGLGMASENYTRLHAVQSNLMRRWSDAP